MARASAEILWTQSPDPQTRRQSLESCSRDTYRLSEEILRDVDRTLVVEFPLHSPGAHASIFFGSSWFDRLSA